MAKPKVSVLMVEDHPQTVYTVRPLFSQLQMDVSHASSVSAALNSLAKEHYDLLVVDRNLPDGDGLEVLEELKQTALPSRVLVLSHKGQSHEKAEGLDAGADDYLPKPFSSDEFRARVRALMRRGPAAAQEVLEYEELQYFPNERTLRSQGRDVRLSALPARMLELLLRSSTHSVSRQTLMNTLWPADKYPQDSSVDVLASRLRKVLLPLGMTVKAHPGTGYSLGRRTLK